MIITSKLSIGILGLYSNSSYSPDNESMKLSSSSCSSFKVSPLIIEYILWIVDMQTFVDSLILLPVNLWRLYNSLNFRPSPGTSNFSNSDSACTPKFDLSTKNKILCAFPFLIKSSQKLTATNVFPEPVAIWIKALGSPLAKESFILVIALFWTDQRFLFLYSLFKERLYLRLFFLPFLIHSSKVSGLWNAKISLLLGFESHLFVKWISVPELSYKKGKSSSTFSNSSGKPPEYFAVWGSLPLRVKPSFLASIIPTAIPLTNNT